MKSWEFEGRSSEREKAAVRAGEFNCGDETVLFTDSSLRRWLAVVCAPQGGADRFEV